MNQQNIKTWVLPNGLRVVHVADWGSVTYCGVVVNAGSRDDEPGKLGLAHFVEHTLFKGTTHRRSWHIINRMEAVGGELNAYTTKETTVLYSVAPNAYLARATELIADLVKNSVFPKVQIDREREVVMDEAASYRDQPGEAIFDDFEDRLFAGSSLGHNILGVEQDLRSITSEDCMRYLHRLYVPSNMVYFVCSNCKPEQVHKLAERHFGAMHEPLLLQPRVVPPVQPPFSHTEKMQLHQCHTLIGARIFSLHDDRRYAMALLSNMIGGQGMNSRLNVELRERRGMVYTVDSNVSLMSDCGMMQIYFGCDDHHLARATQIVGRVIEEIASHGISERALQAAKRQYAGQLLVASSSIEARALSVARSMLMHGSVMSDEETLTRINDVTNEQIRESAAMIAPGQWSVLSFV
ncbi:MAG: M16 family metallopeptidase [Muribaculaceae bacterium]